MRKILAMALLSLLPAACDSAGDCERLADDVAETGRVLDSGNATLDDFAASDEAVEAWRAAGCDQ